MDDELARVVALELQLLEPAVRDDPARLLAHLHPDFREHGASGRRWDRASVAAATAGASAAVPVSDVEARWLGPDAALVTYRSHAPDRPALRSSVWVRHDGDWLLLFHQGTPAG